MFLHNMLGYISWLLPFLALCQAVPLSEALFGRKLLKRATPPSQDPFYAAPANLAAATPGAILRSRPVPNPLTLNNVAPINVQNATQILYRTQNSVGAPEAAMMTVIEPFNSLPDHHMSFQYFDDAATGDCAPSIALQTNAPAGLTETQSQMIMVIAALSRGWFVSVADADGPQGAFSAGLQNGYAVLDSIRATLASGPITGINSTALTTMTGYSGGGVETSWAVELQPTYAPELNIAGAAYGGLSPNITSTSIFMGGGNSTYAGLVPPGLVGISHDYQNMSDWLAGALNPDNATSFMKVNTQCESLDSSQFSGMDIGTFFTNGWAALSEPVPESVLTLTGVLGLRGKPTIPIYVFESINDEVAPIADTDALMQKYCDMGSSVVYERNTDSGIDHVSELYTRFPGAFQWLVNLHNGIAAGPGCTQTELSAESTSANLPSLVGETLAQIILAYEGAPVTNWFNTPIAKKRDPLTVLAGFIDDL